jgi:hypothetical protein
MIEVFNAKNLLLLILNLIMSKRDLKKIPKRTK